MGWLIALGILVLLGLLPIGLGIGYREEKLSLRAKVAGIPIPIDLMGLMTKERKPKKKKKKPRPEDQPKNPNAPKKKEAKMGLDQLMPLIRLGLDFLGDLRWKIRVDHLDLHLVLAGSDPCDLAIAYGNTWAAMGNLLARLEKSLVIRHRDINIGCDFTADKTLAEGRLDLHVTLGRMVGLVAVYGFRGIKLLLTTKKRKGGA